MYSNILLKDPPFTEGELASVLCTLSDTTLYNIESGNDRLRFNVVQSLQTFLRMHPLTISTHKQYMRDIAARLMGLLTVEDRHASHEILLIYRRIISRDRLLVQAREQEELINKSMQLLNSHSNPLKEEAFRLMTCIAAEFTHSRFIIAHYAERLVKLLSVADKRIK